MSNKNPATFQSEAELLRHFRLIVRAAGVAVAILQIRTTPPLPPSVSHRTPNAVDEDIVLRPLPYARFFCRAEISAMSIGPIENEFACALRVSLRR